MEPSSFPAFFVQTLAEETQVITSGFLSGVETSARLSIKDVNPKSIVSSNESEFGPESSNYLNFLVLWSCILDGSWLGIYPFASGQYALVLWVKKVSTASAFQKSFFKSPSQCMLFSFLAWWRKEQSRSPVGVHLVRPYRLKEYGREWELLLFLEFNYNTSLLSKSQSIAIV